MDLLKKRAMRIYAVQQNLKGRVFNPDMENWYLQYQNSIMIIGYLLMINFLMRWPSWNNFSFLRLDLVVKALSFRISWIKIGSLSPWNFLSKRIFENPKRTLLFEKYPLKLEAWLKDIKKIWNSLSSSPCWLSVHCVKKELHTLLLPLKLRKLL